MFKPDGTPWLTPPEQVETIEQLLLGNLLKADNARSLPLKSGGKTDIYANLRMMRNTPSVMRFLADLYANPIRRLHADRIVEVPEAVSPLAGLVAGLTGLPLVTVREQAKEGRVVGGTLIGDVNSGDRVVIIDDVVTDGASKIAALKTLRAKGADIAAIIVLIDRQQGWEKTLSEAGFGDVPVWAGMTLHDVRKYLIEHSLMQRCDPATEAMNPIIIGLDSKNWEDILPLLDRCRTGGFILKVNDLLWARGLDWLLPHLSVYGRVMADVKGYDIPNTIANICRRMAHCPPWAVTVHASGGYEMMCAARATVAGTGTKILAVTVLTSMDKETCQEVYTRLPLGQVKHLAKIARQAGIDGFVCSPEEVGVLSKLYPGLTFVTPGVRSPGKDIGDQKRVDTPATSYRRGATHLVMGRQIMNASDPVAEARRVMTEELGLTVK